MDQINAFFESVGIFKKLGIDSTVIFQFIIFLVTFFILKALFFSKLLFVIMQREEKTTKLEGSANDKFAEAEKMSAKYSNKIHEANVEAQEVFTSIKSSAVDTEKARFKQVEAQVNTELDLKRTEIEAEFIEKKEKILTSADELAGDLSNRLTV